MKVGDVVVKTSDIPKSGCYAECILGIVVKIEEWNHPDMLHYSDETWFLQKKWMKALGRRIEVLWSDGSLSTGYVESGLKIVSTTR